MASSSTFGKEHSPDAPGTPLYPPSSPQETAPRNLRKKRLWIILGTVAAIVILAIALGVGLGVGLHKGGKGHKNSAYSFNLPGGPQGVPPGQDDSRSGMLESGSYTTTYDDSDHAFSWSPAPMNWNESNPQAAHITIHPEQSNTEIDGFGASLTDTSAYLLTQIKQSNETIYNQTLYSLFNRRSGLNILRVPIGASDYSLPHHVYTFADQQGSNAEPLSKFNDRGAQQWIYPILLDVLKVNPDLKISILPWTPPSWMKANGDVNGGTLNIGMTSTLAEYLAKSVQAFDQAVGKKPWGISLQNEPFNSMPYPSMIMTPPLQVQLLSILRGRLAELGYGQTNIWGLEDNFVHWDSAEQLIKSNVSNLDGIAWHCYNGSWDAAQTLRNVLGNDVSTKLKMSMTECTGQEVGADVGDVSSFKWWSNNIFFPMLSHNFSSILVWNLALNSNFGPHLQSTVCQTCKGAIEVNPYKSVSPSLQSVMLQHMAVASSDLSRFGGSVATSVNATVRWHPCASALAFQAPWNSNNRSRYGLVVENNCNVTSMTVALNDKSTRLNFVPGLSSYVWTE